MPTPFRPLTWLFLALLCASPPAVAARPGTTDQVVRDLQQHAQPVRDLGPLGRMVGNATVVGAGEATHGTHEFFTMKHRIFQHLVREKGFTTFSLEAPWSAGLRLNEYVLSGKGDPRQIMREEFYLWHDNREYLELVEWMRLHNLRSPHKVQFMGNDIVYPGNAGFDEVLDYVRRSHPDRLPEFTDRYIGLRPDAPAREWVLTYPRRPLDVRQADAASARQALELLQRLGPGRHPEQLAWAVQHARAVTQTFTLWSYDFDDAEQASQAWRFRDEAMADNVVWWRTRTNQKILLSAHNGHVAVESFWDSFPKVQGTYLRERLGAEYVSIGFTFFQGSFNAIDPADNQLKTAAAGPAETGSNEHTLDQVDRLDYALDLRTITGAATRWLDEARPTYVFAEFYPAPPTSVALGRSYDVLVHLHSTRPSNLN